MTLLNMFDFITTFNPKGWVVKCKEYINQILILMRPHCFKRWSEKRKKGRKTCEKEIISLIWCAQHVQCEWKDYIKNPEGFSLVVQPPRFYFNICETVRQLW